MCIDQPVISWFIVFLSVRQWKETLTKNNILLTQHTSDMTILNRKLDQKVSARTTELSNANKELQQEIMLTEQLGAQGFPSLVLQHDGTTRFIEHSYTDVKQNLRKIRSLLI